MNNEEAIRSHDTNVETFLYIISDELAGTGNHVFYIRQVMITMIEMCQNYAWYKSGFDGGNGVVEKNYNEEVVPRFESVCSVHQAWNN